jgi:FtsP/CotA-like multicopper oxidase with cupredoxin domain
MNDSDKKLNVLPGLAAVALILAAAGFAAAVVAIGKSNGQSTESGATTSGGSMSGMSPEDMGHMAAVSIAGIAKAPADQGNTPLKGVLRNGVLEFTLAARPVWWRIHGKQRLAAYAYNGIVPGPQIRVRNGQRVRIRFTNQLPVETTIHWHGIGVPNSQDGVPGVTQQASAAPPQ